MKTEYKQIKRLLTNKEIEQKIQELGDNSTLTFKMTGDITSNCKNASNEILFRGRNFDSLYSAFINMFFQKELKRLNKRLKRNKAENLFPEKLNTSGFYGEAEKVLSMIGLRLQLVYSTKNISVYNVEKANNKSTGMYCKGEN